MSVEALTTPKQHTLDAWLDEKRDAMCGEKFIPTEPMWRPDPTKDSVNWQAALYSVEDYMKPWLHVALALYMAEWNQSTVSKVASIISRVTKAEIDILNEEHLVRIRERLSTKEFANLVSFIKYWGNSGLEQKPSPELLNSYTTVPRKKQVNNDVVLNLDPERGPLTAAEANALFHWIHEQFKSGNLAPERFLYLLLMMTYGARSVQQLMWVFDDFFEEGGQYKIRIFWAKQKGGYWREEAQVFDLREDHYQLIQSYRTQTLEKLKATYPVSANWDKAIGNVPLFRRVSENVNKNRNTRNHPVLVPSENHRSLEQGPCPEFHASSGSIRDWLRKIQNYESFPISHRTLQAIKITNAHRFRHTFGTDLSNQGYTVFEISAALLHKHPMSSQKYRQVSAELLKLVDEKMTDHLAVAVNAFTGRIVTSRDEAINGDQADRQIKNVAVCGSIAICHLDAPYTCYACPKFQPLLDGAHSKALTRLEKRREQAMKFDKTTGGLWDRAILACRKVILDCKKIKESNPNTEVE